MTNGASLEIRNLTKRFGGVAAIDDLSFDVPQGKTVGIIGPNGAGKSTLLALLSGLLQPDAGTIRIDGSPLTAHRSRNTAHAFARHGVRRTFQDSRLIPQAPVSEHLELAAPAPAWPTIFSALFRRGALQDVRRRFHERARSVLSGMDLQGTFTRSGRDLSYGQSKLVELARVELARSRILLLDEPFSGLAPAMRGTMTDMIRGLAAEGRTILLVEHNLPLIQDLCDRVLVLAAGRRLAFGSYADISSNPDVIDAYVGH
ncbi:ATP-binding cassette domain-containing protein [Candidatus Uhrbacteria bacterium]|nr:ATP-binding cassette domain-containing protein [Candidatus Uhrbacteria bacterium]